MLITILGEVVVCQTIFSGKGITNQMAPKLAVDKIKNLLVSCTENGHQDHRSMLDVLKKFDKFLTKENIERPVVVLSDGHSSRFDFKVLKFLRESNIHLYITPPDTTGVTQLLDQSPNQKLHQEYEKKKNEMFTPFQTIKKEMFMKILAEIWDKWATKSVIVNAAKRVGIFKEGLSVNEMQQDKFEQAARCMEREEPKQSTPAGPQTRSAKTAALCSKPLTESALSKVAEAKYKYDTKEYWKFMYEHRDIECPEKDLNLEQIPGLLTVNKVKPKEIAKKTTKITNVHGSMEAQDILTKVELIEKEKNKKQTEKLVKEKKKESEKELFYRCKTKCVCKGICAAKHLRECPNCHSVMRSVCSKGACKINGKKPVMLQVASSTITRSSVKRLATVLSEESDQEHDENSDNSDSDVSLPDVTDESNSLAISVLKKTWNSVSPPISEKDIQGLWYGVILREDKCQVLNVAKLVRRFLSDENGEVEMLEMECLIPKHGHGNILQASSNPEKLIFPLKDLIMGPLKVEKKSRVASRSFEFKEYESLKMHYEVVKTMDIGSLTIK